MTNELKQAGVTFLGVVVIFAICVAIGYDWPSWRCSNRWSASGMRSQYRAFAGCQVEVSPGKFIPETAYRVVP